MGRLAAVVNGLEGCIHSISIMWMVFMVTLMIMMIVLLIMMMMLWWWCHAGDKLGMATHQSRVGSASVAMIGRMGSWCTRHERMQMSLYPTSLLM